MERTTLFADVLLPLPVPGAFTYRVPFEMNDQVRVGMRVVVQFGSRKIYTGLVRRIHETPPAKGIPKYVLSVIDESPVVHESQFEFWDWIASYYLCTAGEVMNAALPSVLKLTSETRIAVNPAYEGSLDGMNERELMLLEALGHRKIIEVSEVSRILGHQKVIPVINTMIDKGIIVLEEEVKERYKPRKEKFITLSPDYAEDEEHLKELFDSLERRARKQLDVLMTFLHLGGPGTGRGAAIRRTELIKNIEGGGAALDSLLKKKIFIEEQKEVSRLETFSETATLQSILLSPEQERALMQIHEGFEENGVVLLHGVTSSGKTELYIKLIQEAIEAGKQALYLLPEIALTTQIINRLRKYFGERIGIYHSRLNEQERAEVWNRTLAGRYEIILGARSAVFLPLANPGLIIIDEEHDYSYKQVDPAPRYNARDAALFLARTMGARALLGSATPSLESYFNAKHEKYTLVELSERYGNMRMPEIVVLDIKKEYLKGKMKSHFSSLLLDQLEQALKNKEQAILFQNRRGFSLRLECETCHWMPTCKNCDVTLVYHKKINQLRCHYCGYVTTIPEKCPDCGGSKIRMKGFGTERVEEDLQILLPGARISRMDLDTTRSKNSHQKIINDFEEQKIDILVGTQMVTKGLDFDHVSTVCVLNADNMLSYPDFRSAERSYQLMAQVSGRSGRKNKQGKVIIQTYQPSNPIIRDVVNHDYASMYLLQLNDRKKFKYPPFYRLVNLKLKHKDPDLLGKAAGRLASELRKVFGTRVLGPEFPVVSRIMNLYIKQIMIKFEKGASLASMKNELVTILENFEKEKDHAHVRVIIDVDPL